MNGHNLLATSIPYVSLSLCSIPIMHTHIHTHSLSLSSNNTLCTCTKRRGRGRERERERRKEERAREGGREYTCTSTQFNWISILKTHKVLLACPKWYSYRIQSFHAHNTMTVTQCIYTHIIISNILFSHVLSSSPSLSLPHRTTIVLCIDLILINYSLYLLVWLCHH